MSESTLDPLSALAKVLAGKAADKEADAPVEDPGNLEAAAGLVLGRDETKVQNVLDSPALLEFRTQFAAGMVEANLLNRVLDEVILPLLTVVLR